MRSAPAIRALSSCVKFVTRRKRQSCALPPRINAPELDDGRKPAQRAFGTEVAEAFSQEVRPIMKRIIAGFVLLAAGCASHPPPTDHLASAIAATRGAQEAGAQQVPRAALQLKLAEEQIAQARKMIDDGDNERADFMTLRAYNDAELAVALAREDVARRRALQATAEASKAEGVSQ